MRQFVERRSHRYIILLAMLILAACGDVGLPQVTPTVAPTRTASATPETTLVGQLSTRTPIPTETHTTAPTLTVVSTETSTPSPTLPDTETPTATPTETASPTATVTPSLTLTDAPTQTPTFTASPTNTPTNTSTPSATWTPTVTLLPLLLPTETFTLTATITPSLTPTSTLTPEPTSTPTLTPTFTPVPPTRTSTPDLTGTAEALFTDTPQASSTPDVPPDLPPTFTPFPTPSSTRTLAPTLDVTPTFVTAAPDTPAPEPLTPTFTPEQGDEDQPSEDGFPTLTPTLAPTVANVNPPATLSLDQVPQISLPDIQSRAFALNNADTTAFTLSGVSNPTLFVRNPRDPSEYVATDGAGLLYTISANAAQRITQSPFSGLETTREDNNAIVVDAAWSPDGTAVAFIVDADKAGDDGVWWYEPNGVEPTWLLVDCNNENDQNCQKVQRGDPPYFYESRSLVWSPQSDQILVQVYVFGDPNLGGDRYDLIVLPRRPDPDGSFRSVRAHALEYEYGDWTPDGRIVFSGRRYDGRVLMGIVNADDTGEQVILDGSALGLWIQDAVMNNGRLFALGRAGDRNGPMQIMDQNGTFLTQPIGTTPPTAVKWSPERDRAYVLTEDGRKFIANINGTVTEITQQVGDIQAVEWVSGRLPPEASAAPFDTNNVPEDFIPSGVIEGSRFQAGQQLRVDSTATGQLNLRSLPDLSAEIIGGLPNGNYVAILAGPRFKDDVEWWQVQTASGQIGWMAGAINGSPVLVP